MSKIALNSNASGTGVFTIESPNSDTDYTINLPEISGGEFVATDASGNVGIGTTNPSPYAKLHINSESVDATRLYMTSTSNAVQVIGKPATNGMFIDNESDTASEIIFRNGSAYNERMRIDSSGNAYFYANGGELRFTLHSFYRPGEYGSGIHLSTNRVLPANENGSVSDNTEDLGASTYRWKDLYLSGGAYIGGTAAANHLDDYEEGTWTPVLSGSTGAPSINYGFRTGTYVKVGNTVIARWGMQLSTKSGGSGIAEVTGLPFSGKYYGPYLQPSCFSNSQGLANDADGPVLFYVNDNNSKMSGRVMNNADTPLYISDFQANSWCIGTIIYDVT